jgi:hypothetical protein
VENGRLVTNIGDGVVLTGDDSHSEADRIRGDASVDRTAASVLGMDATSKRALAEESFDSASRRERFAASLEGKVDRDILDARITVLADQAKHPREAVLNTSKPAPRARRSSAGIGPQRDRQRR